MKTYNLYRTAIFKIMPVNPEIQSLDWLVTKAIQYDVAYRSCHATVLRLGTDQGPDRFNPHKIQIPSPKDLLGTNYLSNLIEVVSSRNPVRREVRELQVLLQNTTIPCLEKQRDEYREIIIAKVEDSEFSNNLVAVLSLYENGLINPQEAWQAIGVIRQLDLEKGKDHSASELASVPETGGEEDKKPVALSEQQRQRVLVRIQETVSLLPQDLIALDVLLGSPGPIRMNDWRTAFASAAGIPYEITLKEIHNMRGVLRSHGFLIVNISESSWRKGGEYQLANIDELLDGDMPESVPLDPVAVNGSLAPSPVSNQAPVPQAPALSVEVVTHIIDKDLHLLQTIDRRKILDVWEKLQNMTDVAKADSLNERELIRRLNLPWLALRIINRVAILHDMAKDSSDEPGDSRIKTLLPLERAIEEADMIYDSMAFHTFVEHVRINWEYFKIYPTIKHLQQLYWVIQQIYERQLANRLTIVEKR